MRQPAPKKSPRCPCHSLPRSNGNCSANNKAATISRSVSIVNLAIRLGTIYSVSIRRGTGHDDIDKTIVEWVQANLRTYPWFAGGDHYVISMNVDPAVRQVVFPKT
jgi:hypothetical protein